MSSKILKIKSQKDDQNGKGSNNLKSGNYLNETITEYDVNLTTLKWGNMPQYAWSTHCTKERLQLNNNPLRNHNKEPINVSKKILQL